MPLSFIYVLLTSFLRFFWWLSYFAAPGPLLSRRKGYKGEGARWLARGTKAMATLAHVEALRALKLEALSRLVGLATEGSEQGTNFQQFSFGPSHHLVLLIHWESDFFQNFSKVPKTQTANVKITSLPPLQCPCTPWWRRWRQRGHWAWRRRAWRTMRMCSRELGVTDGRNSKP